MPGAKVLGAEPDLVWERTHGKIDAGALLAFVFARLAGLGGGAKVLDLAVGGQVQ